MAKRRGKGPKAAKGKAKRTPVVFSRDPEAFAKTMTDKLVEWLRAERKRRGLPPLPKKAPPEG